MAMLNGSAATQLKPNEPPFPNETFSNSSQHPTVASWGLFSSINLAISIGSFLCNLTALAMFFRHPALRTPFNILLINLLLYYAANVVLFLPIEVITNLYPRWWMGPHVCTFYLYGSWALQSSMSCSHCLISLNRIWAVTMPIAYRHHNTRLVAYLSVLAMWVYVNSMLLPGIILDGAYYRLPLETHGCNINTAGQPLWSMIIQILAFDLPVATVILAYPLICIHTFGLRRVGPKISPQAINPDTQTATVPAADGNAAAPPIPLVSLENSAAVARVRWKAVLAQERLRRARKGRRPAFIVVTLMTLATMVFYMPSKLYFTVIIFWQVDWHTFLQIAVILYSLAGVVDPLFVILSIPELRAKVRNLFPF
ncbi:hypothetical protein BV898_15264 [Hypsibius exemplaris]|uniref:G-protein coupled receptors family 1 profile domain-containing protein n=1 Tax=Hypsibius exemplaris TaxID=2072580 RepID=A0A9X6NCN3_HYPEX|nr:hypothetical protein BV898_15264 [Hypsibius exemplaris]